MAASQISAALTPDDPDLVRVFEHDPDLLQDLDQRTADHVRTRAVARVIRVEPGPWEPPARLRDAAPPGWLGLLVIDGLLTRSLRIDGRDCPELLGTGDLLQPWPSPETPGPVHWKALVGTRVAVLDDRFAKLAGHWPQVFARLLERSSARVEGLSFRLALVSVRRAEPRLLLLLTRLADRWGRMTTDGVVLPLPLTHDLLARLASMRRPTATAALHRLMDDGRLDRRADGCWVLPPASASMDRSALLAA